jgi:hypothetical protein
MQPLVLKIVNADGFGDVRILKPDYALKHGNLDVLGNPTEPLWVLWWKNYRNRQNKAKSNKEELNYTVLKSIMVYKNQMYIDKAPRF